MKHEPIRGASGPAMISAGLDRRRLLAVALAAPMAGCGYLLYPERRGRTSGRIDAGVLVVDLLWLIPGIVPGAVCLIVDYTTGCIYAGPGAVADDGRPVRPREPIEATVELDGAVVADGTAVGEQALALRWRTPSGEAELRARGTIRVGDRYGRAARAPLSDLI